MAEQKQSGQQKKEKSNEQVGAPPPHAWVTPDKAEGDREIVEESLRDKEKSSRPFTPAAPLRFANFIGQ